MDGVINIFKPRGMTSHDVVNFVRKQLSIRRVGHTGTLDPDAEGVLPICVGKGTKIAELLTAEDKVYCTQMTLGIVTDTQDSTGKYISQNEVDISLEIISKTISQFVGQLSQVPPMFSAVKINGRKMYEYARRGIEIERKARDINIYSIEVLDIQNSADNIHNPIVDMLVHCSKGTYIRTLCHDIGQALGCGAHMSKLLRVQTGRFHADNSVTLEQLSKCCQRQDFSFIIPIGELFKQSLTVSPEIEKKVVCGDSIPTHYFNRHFEKEEIYSVYNQQNKLLCLSTVVMKHGICCLKMYKSFW